MIPLFLNKPMQHHTFFFLGRLTRLTISMIAIFCVGISPAQPTPARITVAILPFADETKEPDASHWRHSLPGMLGLPLEKARAIRIYPSSAADYGLRKFRILPGEKIEERQAREIGEVIEARRVIWGSFRREGKAWAVTARVTITSSGKTSAPLTVISEDWQQLAYELAGNILNELATTPTTAEAELMKKRITSSARALESYSRCFDLLKQSKPYPEIEKMASKAIELDRQFASAYYAYGACLMSQGKLSEATAQFEKSLELQPDLARSHTALAVISLVQSQTDDALKMLLRSIAADPDDEENYMRMAELHALSKDFPKAIEQLEIAQQINPVSAEVKAQLGRIYAMSGQREKSLQAMQDAVMIDSENANVYQMTFQGYFHLGMKSNAIEHGETFVKKARALGIAPKAIDMYADEIDRLKASLKVYMLEAEQPRSYSQEELHKELQDKLTAAELAQIIYPYDSTPAMKKWALQKTAAAGSHGDKARALFDAMSARLDPGPGGILTAKEVFDRWENPDSSFRCQEYARFYVALARDLGLSSHYVYVKKNHEGQQVIHACAALFLDGKLILVDPHYRWYGIPHQEYEIMNDLEAIAHQMNQSRELSHNRISVKLQPRSTLALYNLAGRLIRENLQEEAKLYWEKMWELDAESWMAHSARGMSAWMNDDLETAEKELRTSADLCYQDANIWYNLGSLYAQRSKWKEAREAFRSCLRYKPDAQTEQQSRRGIALITEVLEQEKKLEHLDPQQRWRQKLMTHLQANFQIFEWKPMIYPQIGLVFDDRDEPMKIAAEDLQNHCKAYPDDVMSRYRLTRYLKGIEETKASDEAWANTLTTARRLLEKNPHDAASLRIMMLAADQDEAEEPYVKKGMESSPRSWITWICLAEHETRMIQRQIFSGMKNLPASGIDMKRLADLVKTKKIYPPEARALITKCEEVFSHCNKTMEFSHDELEPCLEVIGLRSNLLMLLKAIGMMSDVPVDSVSEQEKMIPAVVDIALERCDGHPRALAALSFMRAQWLLEQALQKGDPAAQQQMRQQAAEVMTQAAKRLLDLSRQPDSPHAADAFEGYAAIMWGIKVMKFPGKFPTDFKEQLRRATQQQPQRCLLWDILLSHELMLSDMPKEEHARHCFALAMARAKAIDSFRSKQFVASIHPDAKASLDLWHQLADARKNDLSHQLNAVISMIHVDSTEAGLWQAQTRLQEIGDRGYEHQYWQKHPDLNLERLKIYSIVQMLLGKSDIAARTLDKVLEMSPEDDKARALKTILAEKP